MEVNDKVYVAGHRGMVGSAIVRGLNNLGFKNVVYQSSNDLDLRDQKEVQAWFARERPKYVFLAAAKVGGILANRDQPASFLYDNVMIQSNVIDAAYHCGVDKLLFLGSSCIYPKLAGQPINERSLLTGPLEETNRSYAIAKIAGIEMCQSYRRQYNWNAIGVMPCNLYGPNDNYDLQNSHVLPALIRKFYEAKRSQKEEVVIWGSGSPLREFLHVDDLADACIFLMQNYDNGEIINVGTGSEISIKDLALLIKKEIGYQGKLVQDISKPDGTPRKVMDNQKITALGWAPKVDLVEGIRAVIKDYSAFANDQRLE